MAKGLKVEYLTREAANATDMMAFFPADNPTHVVNCVEGGRTTLANGKLNPSVQRVSLQTGQVETILRGLTACDGIRITPWATILATEETSDGGAYEILNPLATTEITVTTRGACGVPAVFNPSTTAWSSGRLCPAWPGKASPYCPVAW